MTSVENHIRSDNEEYGVLAAMAQQTIGDYYFSLYEGALSEEVGIIENFSDHHLLDPSFQKELKNMLETAKARYGVVEEEGTEKGSISRRKNAAKCRRS